MKITKIDGKLMVPDTPTIPFVEGDGVGAEVTPVMQAVVNAAVEGLRRQARDRMEGSARRRQGP